MAKRNEEKIMFVLLWFGSSFITLVIYLVLNALWFCNSADKFVQDCMTGNCIVFYLFMVLCGFLGMLILILLTFVDLIFYINENCIDKKLGRKVYFFINKLFKRKKVA